MGGPVSRPHERRRSPRVPAGRTPWASARLVGGGTVTVVNVSRHGAAMLGRERARPGQSVVVFWPAGGAGLRVRARVTRASISALCGEGGVEYSIGVEFVDPADAPWELTTRPG